MTFKAAVLNGYASLTGIDDWIDIWHTSSNTWLDQFKLNEWLGFTEEEYALWVSAPESLYQIVYGKPLSHPQSI